jgi:hypothetical protein
VYVIRKKKEETMGNEQEAQSSPSPDDRLTIPRSVLEEGAEILYCFLVDSMHAGAEKRYLNIASLGDLEREALEHLGTLKDAGIEPEDMSEYVELLIAQVRLLRTPTCPCEVFVLTSVAHLLPLELEMRERFGLEVRDLLPTKDPQEKLVTYLLQPFPHLFEDVLTFLRESQRLVRACAFRFLQPSGDRFDEQEAPVVSPPGGKVAEGDTQVYQAWRDDEQIDVLTLSEVYSVDAKTCVEQIAMLAAWGKSVTNGSIEDELAGIRPTV